MSNQIREPVPVSSAKINLREWLSVAIAGLAIVIALSNQVSASGTDAGRTVNRIESLEKRMVQIEEKFDRVSVDIAYLRSSAAEIKESTSWLKMWISRAEEARK